MKKGETYTLNVVRVDELMKWCKEFKPRHFQIDALLDKLQEELDKQRGHN